jgi:hypothetical protein
LKLCAILNLKLLPKMMKITSPEVKKAIEIVQFYDVFTVQLFFINWGKIFPSLPRRNDFRDDKSS